MKRLVSEPTNTALWQNLVKDASAVSDIRLSENVESYLVFMLMRYVRQHRAFANALGLDFLKSQNERGRLKEVRLQDTADRCVIVAGLFPELAKRRLVSVNYFVDLAYSGYDQISRLLPSSENRSMYQELSRSVSDMVVILISTWQLDKMNPEVAQAYAEILRNHHGVQ